MNPFPPGGYTHYFMLLYYFEKLKALFRSSHWAPLKWKYIKGRNASKVATFKILRLVDS